MLMGRRRAGSDWGLLGKSDAGAFYVERLRRLFSEMTIRGEIFVKKMTRDLVLQNCLM